jgi:flagellar hook-basal body complex protein FliE
MQIPAIMPVSLPAIASIPEIGAAQKTSASGSTKAVTQTFESMLNSLNQSQANSDTLMQQLAQGDNVDLHTVMIGMEENNVNFNVALGIRDKLVDAYREIMRMQV